MPDVEDEQQNGNRIDQLADMLAKAIESMTRLSVENNELNKQVLNLTTQTLNKEDSTSKEARSPSTPMNKKQYNNSRSRANRPTAELDMDDVQWTVFLDSWQRYKRIAELDKESKQTICDELREACDPEVNKLMFKFVGASKLSSSELKEEELLAHIKSVAVRSIHHDVHSWTFNGLTQEQGETVSRFVGRLKAQAALCDFNVTCNKCTEPVSYAEQMVSGRLTAGLKNVEHQTKLLSEANELNTLGKKVERLVSLEATEEAQDQIRIPSLNNAIKTSEYKRQQNVHFKKNPNHERSIADIDGRKKYNKSNMTGIRRKFMRRRCRGCGKTNHGEGKSMRRTDCPFFGKKCKNCKIENHCEEVCEKRHTRISMMRTRYDTSCDETTGDESEYSYSYDETSDTESDTESIIEASSNLGSRLVTKDFRSTRASRARFRY